MTLDTEGARLFELDLEYLEGFEDLIHHGHWRLVACAVDVEWTLVHREDGRGCLEVGRRAGTLYSVVHHLASKILVELERLLIFTLLPVLARLSRVGLWVTRRLVKEETPQFLLVWMNVVIKHWTILT